MHVASSIEEAVWVVVSSIPNDVPEITARFLSSREALARVGAAKATSSSSTTLSGIPRAWAPRQGMNMTIRFGIAGLGAVSNDVLPELMAHPEVAITAAADLRPEAREKFAREFGGEAYADVEAMCKSPKVDAVYVLTPNHLHAQHATIAAEHGKDVVVTKPIALTLEDCDAMIEAAQRNGVRLMAGTTPAFTPAIMQMAELVRGGTLGRLLMINTWWWNDWLYLPRMPEELDAAKGGGVVFRQGPHQVDIVRAIGGGMVRCVRATTSKADPARPVEGSYAAFLDFEGGAAATLAFNGYAHFDSTELTFGVDARGAPRETGHHVRTRTRFKSFDSPEEEASYKDSVRYAGTRQGAWGGRPPQKRHEFYGLTLVSCEQGDIRQSPDGLLLYDGEGRREIPVPVRGSERDAELDCLYEAWRNDRPLPAHDGRWGKATLEVCLAILESTKLRQEVLLKYQVPS